MIDALAAEWLKIRSVRSTCYVIAVIIAIIIADEAVTLYAVHIWDHLPPARQARFTVSPADQLTGYFGQFVMGVLGVLAITPEYATGMIRASLTAVPQRRILLAAKAGAVAALAFAIGETSVTVTFLASRLIVGNRPMRFYTSPMPHEIPLLFAYGSAITVTALIGLGLGTVMRSSAGAITTIAALWYVLPIIALHLPQPLASWLSSALLNSLPQELADTGRLGTAGSRLPPAAAAAVLAAYAAAALGAGAIALIRRDA